MAGESPTGLYFVYPQTLTRILFFPPPLSPSSFNPQIHLLSGPGGTPRSRIIRRMHTDVPVYPDVLVYPGRVLRGPGEEYLFLVVFGNKKLSPQPHRPAVTYADAAKQYAHVRVVSPACPHISQGEEEEEGGGGGGARFPVPTKTQW